MRFLLAFQQDPDPFQIISNFLESPILRISGQLVLLLFIVLWVSLVYWTYADASRRGSMSVLWGLIRSEEYTSELQSRQYLVCRLLLEKKKNKLVYRISALVRTLLTQK